LNEDRHARHTKCGLYEIAYRHMLADYGWRHLRTTALGERVADRACDLRFGLLG